MLKQHCPLVADSCTCRSSCPCFPTHVFIFFIKKLVNVSHEILFLPLFFHCRFLLLDVQTPAHGLRGDDDEDLNKAFEVQGFHQILNPPANCPPDSYRVYDEQDFEGEIPGETTVAVGSVDS